MTGEVLYTMYAKFKFEKREFTHEWLKLKDSERDVWNNLAKWINETE